ncbi:unnamed protein product [Cuscuta campestris]|uniref:Uncharacterized protein n=1 Tax=Cuscuta campestris TaxID=132261 RepID=A0A484KE97_9ASTE|nr:unnamed protein product [Cuscuta campestris]
MDGLPKHEVWVKGQSELIVTSQNWTNTLGWRERVFSWLCIFDPCNKIHDGSSKLLDFGLCVVVHEKKIGGHYRYMIPKENAIASLGANDEVEEPRTTFYLDQWRQTRSIISPRFGNPKEAGHISDLIA